MRTFILYLIVLALLATISKVNAIASKDLVIKGQYKNVSLGMSREKVISTLEQDPELEIDVQTDYGDFDQQQKYIVKANSKPFINKIYYQFTNIDKTWLLYAIIIHFNPKYNSFIKLHRLLYTKYGPPNKMTDSFAFWFKSNTQNTQNTQNEANSNNKNNSYKTFDGRNINVRLILNRPATLKIIDQSLYKKTVSDKKLGRLAELKQYQQNVNDKLLKDFMPSQDKTKR